eukprot:GHVH01016921.1.p2 GENE.GHVH01016921.1~~GHVH01016921.1.p2  ORF type:complete len:366 (+),score=54.36 GHVH01016921.1:919-2016(+)
MIPAIYHCVKKDQKMLKETETTHKQKFMIKRGASPDVLVVAPTRDLATQIHEASKEFCDVYGFLSTLVIGGSDDKSLQSKNLNYNTRIVIATPGRLLDFAQRDKLINLDNVSYFVLDEADRMLDDSFGQDCLQISNLVPQDRQCGFFSATWSTDCQNFADELLRNKDRMIHVQIGGVGESHGHVATIEHHYKILDGSREKDAWVRSFLLGNVHGYNDVPERKVIIFRNTKRNTKELFHLLLHEDFDVCCMEGDMVQTDRDKSLGDFRDGRRRVLVSTPVSERGIDIKGVAYVLSYDPPDCMEDYTHRSGRTGRAGMKGISIVLYDSQSKSKKDIAFANECIRHWPVMGGGLGGNMNLLELQNFAQ